MTIKAKIAGAYQDVAGVFVKRSGVYEAVAGVFAKVSGEYTSVLGGMFSLSNSRIAGVGDSRTDQLSYGSFLVPIGANTVSIWTSTIDQASNSHLAWLEVLSGSRYRTWIECARGGTSSTYHVDKMVPQAIASGAGAIIYVGNVNDPAYGVTAAQSIANIDSVVAQCKSAGVACILLTDPSGSNTPNQNDFHGVGGINEHILAQHDLPNGIVAIEIRDCFLSKTGDSYLPWTALSDAYYDSPAIHWSIPAAKRAAEKIKTVLDALGWWDAAPGRPDAARNIISNADFATATGGTLGTNNTGTLPSGAAGQSSNALGPVAWSVNTREDGSKEIVGVLTRTEGNTSLRRHEVAWTVGLTAAGVSLGDYVQGGAVVTIDSGHSKVVGAHVMTDISYTGGPSFEQGYKALASTSNGVHPLPAGAHTDLDVRTMAHKTNSLATGFGTCRIRAGIQTNGDCSVTFRIRLPYCIRLNADERQAEFDVYATNTAFPSVSGTAAAGQVLTCTNTTWIANSVPMFSYQWFRTTTTASAGVAIEGATSSAYTIQADDTGNKLFCRVSAATGIGSNTADTALTATVS